MCYHQNVHRNFFCSENPAGQTSHRKHRKSRCCSNEKVPTHPNSFFMLGGVGGSRTQMANSRVTSLSCRLGQRASQAPKRLAATGFVSQKAFQTAEKSTRQPPLCSPRSASSVTAGANVHSFKMWKCTRGLHTYGCRASVTAEDTQREPKRHLQLHFGCWRGATEQRAPLDKSRRHASL